MALYKAGVHLQYSNFQATSLLYLAHHLYFQLWRPTEKGRYKLIDDDHLVFEEPELIGNIYQPSSVHPESDIGFFHFTRKVGKGMYFQPGDVLGYFTPSYKLNQYLSSECHLQKCKHGWCLHILGGRYVQCVLTVWDVRVQKHGDSSLQSSAQHSCSIW